MNTQRFLFVSAGLAALALSTHAQNHEIVVTKPGQTGPGGISKRPLPLPAPRAGGKDVPNIGMHDIKHDGASLPSGAIELPPGVVPSASAPPMGLVLRGIYVPDAFETVTFDKDSEYPIDLYFHNTDPSGSLDETALDENGDPIHFNLHWPQEPAARYKLADAGLDPNSPTNDLEEILDEIASTGSKARIPEALDILLGTNDSGALSNKVYAGYELLRYKGRKDNRSYDPITRNVEITQLWYDTEMYTDCNMLMVPAHGDYTITWNLIGLGDVGPNYELAFPIDEMASTVMKLGSNSLFWKRNSWVWKWFDVVEHADGRKFALESLYEAHTGTSEGGTVPSYSDIDPQNFRYWLFANRKFHYGDFVGGKGDITDLSRWHTYDLDLDGQIGGYTSTGTDTGLPYDESTNPEAQFNVYGNNEYAVPLMDWSTGPPEVPHFAYDSTFTTVVKGYHQRVTVRYAEGENQAGLYNWGWRKHPPRINWIETYADGQILASGAPKDWRFGHKWDEVGELGLAALGEHSPEMIIHDALLAYDASGATPGDIAAFAASIDGMMAHVRDRRGLPPTDDILDFPNPAADMNILMSNLDFFGDRQRMSAPGKRNWDEDDVITITIHNDDNVERYFRVVEFGTTDHQFNGLDFGIFDWKPVFGFPQFAAAAWGSLFGPQGYGLTYWGGSELQGKGNPFYVAPNENDPANFWPAGQRDLVHHFDNLSGFSGPGFHSVPEGAYTVLGNNKLAGKPLGDSDMWRYSYGKPVPANTTLTFQIEMPRAQPLNNGAMYIFDPQFHFASIFTNHPEAELIPEGLED